MTATPIDTKDMILDVALQQFADHGYAGVSLNDIAEAVGIKKPSILHHFSSKEALYRAVILDEFADWVLLMSDAIAKNVNGWDQVEQLLRAAFTFFEQHPYFVRIARREALDPDSLFSTELGTALKPLIDQGAAYLDAEMDAGRLKRYDARQLLITGYGASLSYLSDASLVTAVIDGDPLSAEALEKRREHVIALFKEAVAP
jgi:TetR/AcrR family transcriptional regulator